MPTRTSQGDKDVRTKQYVNLFLVLGSSYRKLLETGEGDRLRLLLIFCSLAKVISLASKLYKVPINDALIASLFLRIKRKIFFHFGLSDGDPSRNTPRYGGRTVNLPALNNR